MLRLTGGSVGGNIEEKLKEKAKKKTAKLTHEVAEKVLGDAGAHVVDQVVGDGTLKNNGVVCITIYLTKNRKSIDTAPINVIPTSPSTKYALSVHAIRAIDLLGADITGKSDPFLVLSFGGTDKQIKTKTKLSTLHPVWNQTFQVSISDLRSEGVVTIEAYDKDLFGKNLIGVGALNLSNLNYHERKETVVVVPLMGGESGGNLKLKLKQKATDTKHHVAEQAVGHNMASILSLGEDDAMNNSGLVALGFTITPHK